MNYGQSIQTIFRETKDKGQRAKGKGQRATSTGHKGKEHKVSRSQGLLGQTLLRRRGGFKKLLQHPIPNEPVRKCYGFFEDKVQILRAGRR